MFILQIAKYILKDGPQFYLLWPKMHYYKINWYSKAQAIALSYDILVYLQDDYIPEVRAEQLMNKGFALTECINEVSAINFNMA